MHCWKRSMPRNCEHGLGAGNFERGSIMRTSEELRDIFWQEDAARGGLTRRQYDEIKHVLAEQDMEWVKARYYDIKAHAIAHTEYYRDHTPDMDFPVMDKMLLMEAKAAHTAKDGYQLPVHISSTSGSTGTPFAVAQDKVKRNRTIADLQVFGELCDFPIRERMVFFRVLNDKLHRTPEQEEKENIYYIDSSDLGETHLEEMRLELIKKRPRILFSYSSTLVELAKYIDRVKTDPAEFGLTSVLTGGEGISEENRKLLERVYGCKVYRRYSDMELGILGQDMGDGGSYILNWGSYYFECLQPDCDEPAAPGEAGRIVITDLFNYAFPMIRYDTGDLGVMEYPEGALPRLKEIYGRSRDCVYTTDGRMLSPARIFVSMWGTAGARQWQFIQDHEKEYILKLNADGAVDTEALTEKFKGILGNDAQIKICFVDEIPVTASNKRRAVICNYKKEK